MLLVGTEKKIPYLNDVVLTLKNIYISQRCKYKEFDSHTKCFHLKHIGKYNIRMTKRR